MLQILQMLWYIGEMVFTDMWWFIGCIVGCGVIVFTIHDVRRAKAYNQNKIDIITDTERIQYEKEYPYSCICSARYKTRSGLGKHKITCDKVNP